MKTTDQITILRGFAAPLDPFPLPALFPNSGVITIVHSRDHAEKAERPQTILKTMMNQTGEIMACPKCKAKIGITSEKIATSSGLSSGRICYICGYWVQEYPDRS